jgi:4-hydroxybenzoate polyprenyltransferase/phosphoserine phosphatase
MPELKQSQLVPSTVLCVDLDGTLVKGNTLVEACFALLRSNPWMLGHLCLWWLRGHAYLWEQVARRTPLNVNLLPVRPEVTEMISKRQRDGDEVVLVTGCHEILAARIAERLKCFSGVYATDGKTHLVGKAKATLLKDLFGNGGFDYIGDAAKDRVIWAAARRKFVVGRYRPPAAVERLGRTSGEPSSLLKSIWRSLRPHQWAKNGLVFLPLLLSHRYREASALLQTAAAALLFCLASSSVYLWNDLLDLEADRRHPVKKNRPLPNSDIPILLAIGLSVALALAAVGGSWFISPGLAGVIGLYIATSTAYSFWLKKLLTVDVVVLACLYVIRLIAGSVATGIPLSFWTLAFSLFFFFSLALAKRYSELRNRSDRSDEHSHRRAYAVPDLTQVNILGIASGLVAVCFVGLYINGLEVRQLYSHPDLLWFICPLILDWCSRLWILAGRGELNEDPVVFAIRDRRSYITGALLVLVVAAAI